MSTFDSNEHAGNVSSMFGRIANWYDFLNRSLSLGQDCYWRYRLVRAVRPGPTGKTLDLAAGTLDVAKQIRKRHPDMKVLAMDIAEPMLRKGQTKIAGDTGGIQPVLADGRFLPLPGHSVDNVTIAFGIRNIRPREDAYSEILRVLAPGGRLCILEFGSSQKKILKGLYNFYLDKLLPFIGKIISGDREAYRYLADTIGEFPEAEKLADELRTAGFERVWHAPLAAGIVNIHVAEKSTDAAPAKPAKKAATANKGAAARTAAAQVDAGLDGFETAAAKAKKATAKKKKAAAKTTRKAPAKKAAVAKTTKKKAATKEKTVQKAAAKKTSGAKTTKKAGAAKKAKPAKKAVKKPVTKKKTAAKKKAPTKKKVETKK